MPQSNSTSKPKGRAKNNLSNFDLSQIEADLNAVEAEALKLDPHSIRNDSSASIEKVEEKVREQIDTTKFKSHPVNVVNFNPDNSKLLHKVLRTDAKVDYVPKNGAVAQKSARSEFKVTNKPTHTKKTPQNLKISTSFKPAPGAVSMDGFRKATVVSAPPATPTAQTIVSKPPVAESITRPAINTSSVALSGMSRANQFNRFTLEQHKTSLQNQIEKKSLFEHALDGDVEVYDKGLQTNGGKKVYNVGRRKSMIGGVDQHNLGPGKVRRTLGYRPMRFIMPVLAVLAIGTYVMYLNLPTISIKVAENKSGVAISEPGYVPDGYKLSKSIEAETGKVAMSFKNDDASYNVSQKVSDWDSKALLENKILKETKEYSAYTDRGLTIYVYDGKATWVNQGKVYEIELGNSKLDVEDTIRIAGSM